MLTLADIINGTPPSIIARVKNCRGSLLRSLLTYDHKGVPNKEIVLNVQDRTTGNPPKIVVFRLYGDNHNIMLDDVWCYCSCNYFRFYLEVVMSLNGSSTIIRAVKDLPTETNPKMIPHCCKHMLSAIPHIKRAAYLPVPQRPKQTKTDPIIEEIKQLF